VEAGRKGGQASVRSRQLRKQRALEAAVFERSKNGYALIRLVELEAKRNRQLEQAMLQAKADAEREARLADYRVCDLLDQADELEREIAERDARVTVLAEREAELRARAESAGRLAELLADVPEDRLEAALILLGHEFVDEGEVSHAAAAQAS
jgi:small-conductance mechanosensitive channel